MLNGLRLLFLVVLQKIFLDTIRLLAEKTNNLLEELWNYIEDGKIIQSAVLLLAAQEQIRGGSSSKINGSSKKNGFDIINKCIMRRSFALRWEKGSHAKAPELLEERKTLTDCAWLLVDVISYAGENLSAYIQAHCEVSIFVYCGCSDSDAFYLIVVFLLLSVTLFKKIHALVFLFVEAHSDTMCENALVCEYFFKNHRICPCGHYFFKTHQLF